MNNFPFIYNGKEWWYSRSIVCAGYVFCNYLGSWWILAAQRGNSQTVPGKWNVPGGFLDHNETTQACTSREVLEETGVLTFFDDYTLYNIIDHNLHGKQHVIFNYFFNMGTVNHLPEVSNKYNEHDETMNIRWIPIDEIHRYHWLHDHQENIMNIYHQKINISLWTMIKNKIISFISNF